MYLRAIFNVLAVPDFSTFALLFVAWCDMIVVVSCNQQHENLIVAWELFGSSLAIACYCHHSSGYDNKK
jgi:hypothetical protein